MNRQEEIDFIKNHAPCYLYRQKDIVAQISKLKEAFGGFSIIYSIKANPYEPIIQTMASEGRC